MYNRHKTSKRTLVLVSIVILTMAGTASVAELILQGKELGHEGEALRAFVSEQQSLQRDARAEVREIEKAKVEAEKYRLEVESLAKQKEMDKFRLEIEEKERVAKADIEEKAKLAMLEAEKEVKLAKLAAEEKEKDRLIKLAEIEAQEKAEQLKFDAMKEERLALADAERELKFKMEKLRLEAEEKDRMAKVEMERDKLEKTKIEVEAQKLIENAKLEAARLEARNSEKRNTGKDPRLPYFDENKDKMDSYIARFEVYATANGWDKDKWSLNLSTLLKGKALEVYHRLSPSDALDFDKLKEALLKNFDLTERGFKQKFRNSRPEGSETFVQFTSRIASYLDKWLQLAKAGKSYNEILDFLVRDQLLDCCNKDLYSYLKEKSWQKAEEMAEVADRYAEPRGGVQLVTSRKVHYESPLKRPVSIGFNRGTSRVYKKTLYNACAKCGGKHFTRECFKANAMMNVDQPDDKSKDDDTQVSQDNEDKSNRGRGNSRFRNNRGGPRNRGRGRGQTYQASFCQTRAMENIEFGTISSLGAPEYEKEGSVCYFDRLQLPITEGYVGDKKVKVLRDTGCTGVVVRRSLVDESQLNGVSSDVRLIDDTLRTFPTAVIEVNCPFFTGKTTALCMDNPIHDLIIGNVNGSKLPDMTHFAASVMTRAQSKKQDVKVQKMKVPGKIGEVTKEEFKVAQGSDPKLQNIRMSVRTGKQTHYRGNKKAVVQFIEKGGLLYRKYTAASKEYLQLVVPERLRNMIMKMGHEILMAGHMGIRKTTSRILTEFYWPGICGDIARFCRSCDICQRTIPKGRIGKVPLGTMPLIDTPFKRVAVDIVGPIEPRSENRNKYILTMIDYATRYPEAVPLPNIETETVAEALVSMFSRVGIPDEMLTDCGTQFMSKVMNETARLLSLQQITTSPRHPQCDGLVERFHATLKQMLKKACNERPKDWDKYIPALLFAVREVPQESLGFSPFELLYGRSVRGPMTIIRELWTGEVDDEEVKTTYQYVIDLQERFEQTCQMAQENLKGAQQNQKRYYDKKAKNRQFEVGDKVLLLLPTSRNKLLMQWNGPFTVVEKVGHCDYRIDKNGEIRLYHANLMKAYVERNQTSSVLISGMQDSDAEKSKGEDDVYFEEYECPNTVRTQTSEDVRIADSLDEIQKNQVKALLCEYDDVFTDVPGRTDVGKHEIKLTSSEPVRSKSYPIPYHKKEILQKEIDEMIRMGVIEPSISPYSSPVVMVPKKDGTVRVCIDYRKVNRITVFDAEPMPNMDDVFAKLAGNNYYSKFDLTKGYWQIPLTEESKLITAFETPGGLYQFTVSPFGLVNSGATFCRIVRQVIKGLEAVESFVDDMWVYSKTWEDHMKALEGLFGRLRKAKLTAKPNKCEIGASEVECLGHRLGVDGISPNRDKIRSIVDAEKPVTKKQVRSFLGLVGFYRRFIPNFSTIASPLTELTKKGFPNSIKNWTEAQEKAFQTLKGRVTKYPVLRLPDFTRKFILQTDASDVGLGAVLCQEFDDGKFPISYASKKLLQREQNYAVIERECLAIIWGAEKFHKYLFGIEFELEIDHKPLMYLQSAKTLNSRLMRWALRLQQYRFRIVAVRGKDNVIADYLSRSSVAPVKND